MKKNSLAAIIALSLSTAALASETQLTVTVTGAAGETLHRFTTLTSQVGPNRIEMGETSQYIAEYETRETSTSEVSIIETGEYKTGHAFDFLSHKKPGGEIYISISGVKMDLATIHEIEGAVSPEIRRTPYKALETLKDGGETNIRLGCKEKDKPEACDFTFNVKSSSFEF